MEECTLSKTIDLSLPTPQIHYVENEEVFLRECLQVAVEADLGKLTFDQADKLMRTGYFAMIDGKKWWRDTKRRIISFQNVIHANQNSIVFYLLAMITSPQYYYETSDEKKIPLMALYCTDNNAKLRWKQKLLCPSRMEVVIRNQDHLEWFSCQTSVKVEVVIRIYDTTQPVKQPYKRVFQPDNFAEQFNFCETILKVPRRWKVTVECSATRDIIVSGVIFQYPSLDDADFDPENHGFRLEY